MDNFIELTNQQNKTNYDLELVHEALLSLSSKAAQSELNRERKDIYLEEKFNNLLKKLEKVSRKSNSQDFSDDNSDEEISRKSQHQEKKNIRKSERGNNQENVGDRRRGNFSQKDDRKSRYYDENGNENEKPELYNSETEYDNKKQNFRGTRNRDREPDSRLVGRSLDSFPTYSGKNDENKGSKNVNRFSAGGDSFKDDYKQSSGRNGKNSSVPLNERRSERSDEERWYTRSRNEDSDENKDSRRMRSATANRSSAAVRDSVGYRVAFRHSVAEQSDGNGQYNRSISSYRGSGDRANNHPPHFESESEYDRSDRRRRGGSRSEVSPSPSVSPVSVSSPDKRSSHPTRTIQPSASGMLPSTDNNKNNNISGADSSRRYSPPQGTLDPNSTGYDRSYQGGGDGNGSGGAGGRQRPSVYGSPHRFIPHTTDESPATIVSTSTGARLKEDPVREVLSKFLDIYQTDQDEIKSRYVRDIAL